MGRAPCLVKLLKRGLHLLKIPLTRIRQSDARVAPFEERNTKFFLQPHDFAADAGLPNPKYLRCPSQASVFSCGYEVADFGKLWLDGQVNSSCVTLVARCGIAFRPHQSCNRGRKGSRMY